MGRRINIRLILIIVILLLVGISGTGFADDNLPPTNERSPNNPAPLKNPEGFLVNPENLPISPNVIGGTEVSPQNKYPWLVSVQFYGNHYCGGTLISQVWVLTAAHCWVDTAGIPYPIYPQDTVVLGEHSLSISSGREQEIGLTEVHIHPDFNHMTFENDFALLKLATPATINDYVKTIDLVSGSPGNLVGQLSDVVGWGDTSYGGSFSDVARVATISVLADSSCLNYGDFYKSSSMLCAGTLDGSKDACQGDSGGPLAFDDGGTWKQVGVVSWGNECGLVGYPGVYSRIAAVSNWVRDILYPKPVLVDPIGTISDRTPLYQWNHVSFATSYTLVVKENNTDVVTWKTYNTANICTGGVCSVDPDKSLWAGLFTWWVLPKDNSGEGYWSNPGNFTIQSIPGRPNLYGPTGTIYDNTPLFLWEHVYSASQYVLVVKENGTNPVVWEQYNSEEICSEVTCSIDPGITLSPNAHTWWVLPKNIYGNGIWSLPGDFNYPAGDPPAEKPGLYAPIGTINDQTPLYQWEEIPSATLYLLVVKENGTDVVVWNQYSATSICSVGTCSVDPGVILSANPHTWWVLPKNIYGNGIWSSPGNFNYIEGDPPTEKPELYAPIGTINDQTPLYQWEEIPSATLYLLVVKENGTDVVVWNQYSATSICSGGTCSVDPGVILSANPHTWWVLPKNIYGNGIWSSPGNFSIMQ